jgi:hypothetical protein
MEPTVMLDTLNGHDPIHAAITRHQEVSKALDDAADRLLEVHPSTLDGLCTLIAYVNDLTSEFGECAAFPKVDGQSFSSRMLEHIAASLLRIRQNETECRPPHPHWW